jgi:hypothetical protein
VSECEICGDESHSTQRHHIDPPVHPDQDGLLPQHRHCHDCGQTTYVWDHQPCHQHAVPGAQRPAGEPAPAPAPRGRTRDLQALALAQARDSRTHRLAWLDSGQRGSGPSG